MTPHNAAGRVVAVVVMLLAIPLFGAVFAILTAAHVHKRVHDTVGAAEKRIAEEADERHVAMQRHVEHLLAEHVSAVAKAPPGGM